MALDEAAAAIPVDRREVEVAGLAAELFPGGLDLLRAQTATALAPDVLDDHRLSLVGAFGVCERRLLPWETVIPGVRRWPLLDFGLLS